MPTPMIIFFLIASLALLILYAKLSLMLDKIEKRVEAVEEAVKNAKNEKKLHNERKPE